MEIDSKIKVNAKQYFFGCTDSSSGNGAKQHSTLSPDSGSSVKKKSPPFGEDFF